MHSNHVQLSAGVHIARHEQHLQHGLRPVCSKCLGPAGGTAVGRSLACTASTSPMLSGSCLVASLASGMAFQLLTKAAASMRPPSMKSASSGTLSW